MLSFFGGKAENKKPLGNFPRTTSRSGLPCYHLDLRADFAACLYDVKYSRLRYNGRTRCRLLAFVSEQSSRTYSHGAKYSLTPPDCSLGFCLRATLSHHRDSRIITYIFAFVKTKMRNSLDLCRKRRYNDKKAIKEGL